MSSRQSNSFPFALHWDTSCSPLALAIVLALALVLVLAAENAIVNDNDTINNVLQVKNMRNYSGDLNTEHSNIGNIRKPNILVFGNQMVEPFENWTK